MNKSFAKLYVFTQKINRQQLQFVFVLLALALFVLGAGAPDSPGTGPR